MSEALSGRRHTAELRQMDRETARNTLTVNEFERWERVNDLHEQAEQTREQWEEQDEQVGELVVRSDPESLGTEVTLHGNELLVHFNANDRHLQAAKDRLDAFYADHDLAGMERDDAGETVEELPESEREAITEGMTECLLDLFDAVVIEWNGTRWNAVPDEQREAALRDCLETWGLEDFLFAWVDVCMAYYEEREEKLDVIESFRAETR